MHKNKIRQCMADARMARNLGLHEACHNFVQYARYWNRMQRLDRANSNQGSTTMNAFTRAKHSIASLSQAMRGTSAARQAFQGRQLGPVRSARIVAGEGMVRVIDADTGRVLGFRRTIREARWLAEALERGVQSA